MLGQLKRYFIRKRTPLLFDDLARNKPVSSRFGLERGTPIDRYYIEKFLEENSPLITGTALEIADSSYSRRYGQAVTSYEVLHATHGNPAATLIGSLTEWEKLPADRIDCFICTQTFNFIYDLDAAIRGAHHLLKPGGVLLATVAGISQISRYDMDRWGDYWRFTTASVERLFSPVFRGGITVASHGNVLAATAFLQGVALEDLPTPSLLDEHDPDYQMVITIVARKARE